MGEYDQGPEYMSSLLQEFADSFRVARGLHAADDMLTFLELRMIGSFGMQAARFPEMLRMVEAGRLHPELLLNETVALEEAGPVLYAMSDYDTVGMSVITEF